MVWNWKIKLKRGFREAFLWLDTLWRDERQKSSNNGSKQGTHCREFRKFLNERLNAKKGIEVGEALIRKILGFCRVGSPEHRGLSEGLQIFGKLFCESEISNSTGNPVVKFKNFLDKLKNLPKLANDARARKAGEKEERQKSHLQSQDSNFRNANNFLSGRRLVGRLGFGRRNKIGMILII